MRVETPPDSAPGIPGADVGPAASDEDADSVIDVSGPKRVEDRAVTEVKTDHTDRHFAAFHDATRASGTNIKPLHWANVGTQTHWQQGKVIDGAEDCFILKYSEHMMNYRCFSVRI